MSQAATGIDLVTSLGYLVKEASSALRTEMESVLRPLGMNITQYSCLELLAQRPDLSNSELARGAFVSRQSMNVLLQAMEREGLVVRPAEPPSGRVLPARLTDRGRGRLQAASAAVRAVEDQMRSTLSENEQEQLRALLRKCVASLQEPARPEKLVSS